VTKTWGPFTGRQLTIIIVALVFGVVMIPGAVWAVDTYSNVAIQDPVSGAKAKVASTGALNVGDGSGPLTVNGTVRTHDGDGPMTVDGAVRVDDGAGPLTVDTRMWQVGQYLTVDSMSGCAYFPNPPAGEQVKLRSVFASVNLPDAGLTRVWLYGHYNAGGFLPAVDMTIPFSGKDGHLTDLDLLYMGGGASGTGTGQLETLQVCYQRGSNTPTRALNIVITGERYVP
jgi:hypothetical protein